MFTKHGEESFRDGERRVIKRLLEKDGVILSTGGGAYINDSTRRIIEDNSVSVWLDVNIGTLWQRVRGKKHRPMLQGAGAKDTLHNLYNTRISVYKNAQIHIRHNKDSPAAMAKKIITQLLAEDIAVDLLYNHRYSPKKKVQQNDT